MPSPPNDSARRFVIGIGVATYDDAALNLPAVPDDVAKVTDWFARRSGIPHEHALPELGDSPSNEQIRKGLSSWLAARSPDDFVIVYIAAHGQVEGGVAYVQGRDSPRQLLSGNAIDGATIGRIIGQSRPQNVLFIVDACVAGRLGSAIQRGAEDVSDQFENRDPYQKWSQAVLCSTFNRDPAYDGFFADAFLNVVTREQWTGTLRPFLDFDRLMEGLNKELEILDVPQVAERKVWGPAPAELIPNPNFGKRQRSTLVADEELASHFDPSARGVTRGEAGFYFIGRHDELSRIVRWLEQQSDGQPRRLLVITGSPGSGKSALIARIVTLSDPILRATVPGLDKLPRETVPPSGSITVALWCHNKTLDQLVAELAARLGINARNAAGLVEAIATSAVRTPPLTIAVDALDEAVAGHAVTIAQSLIVPLASVKHVRVLVATRRRPVFASDSGERADLLDVLAVDPDDSSACIVVDKAENRIGDLRAYVAARLMGTGELGRVTPYSDKPGVAAQVAERVAEAADRSFLVAGVAARTLASRSEVASPEQMTNLPTEAGSALAQYIDRLPDSVAAVDILRPLAWAEGAGLAWGPVWAPVATALARAVRGTEVWYDDAAVAGVLDQASDLIVEGEDFGQPVYRVFHAALAEHLRTDLTPARAHEAIARALDAIVRAGPYEKAPAYALAHLTSHLAQAPGQYPRLYELATSPDWERAQRERFGHSASFLRDVDLAIEGALGQQPPDLASLAGACLVYARQMAVAPAPAIDIIARSGQLQRAERMANNITFALERCWAYARLAPLLQAERDVTGAQRCLAEATRSVAAINATHTAMAWAWIAEASAACGIRDRALAAAREATETTRSPAAEAEWELPNMMFWAGRAARHAGDEETLAVLRARFVERVQHLRRNQELQAASVLGATQMLRRVWSSWMDGERGGIVRDGNLALALAGASMTHELDTMLHVIESEPRGLDGAADARKRFAWSLAMTGRFDWALRVLSSIDGPEQWISALDRIVAEAVRQGHARTLTEARSLVIRAEEVHDRRAKARFVTILYALGETDRAVLMAEDLIREGVEPSSATTVLFPEPDQSRQAGGGVRSPRGKTDRRHLRTDIAALEDEAVAEQAKQLVEAGDIAQATAKLASIRVPRFRWTAQYAIASEAAPGAESVRAWAQALIEARLVNEPTTRITAFALAASFADGSAEARETDRLTAKARTVTKAWTEAAFAEQYDSLRDLLVSSRGRTKRMDELVTTTVLALGTDATAAAVAVVLSLPFASELKSEPILPSATELLWGLRSPAHELWTPADVSRLIATGEPGRRVFALALMESSGALACVDHAIALTEGSLSAFEQFHALKVGLKLAPGLGQEDRKRLRAAIERERQRYIAIGTDRYVLSERVLRSLPAESDS